MAILPEAEIDKEVISLWKLLQSVGGSFPEDSRNPPILLPLTDGQTCAPRGLRTEAVSPKVPVRHGALLLQMNCGGRDSVASGAVRADLRSSSLQHNCPSLQTLIPGSHTVAALFP